MIVDYNFILTEMVDDEALNHYSLDDCIQAEVTPDFVREAMKESCVTVADIITHIIKEERGSYSKLNSPITDVVLNRILSRIQKLKTNEL